MKLTQYLVLGLNIWLLLVAHKWKYLRLTNLSRAQVGLVLDGVEVNRTIIGGPAYTSKRFAKGDILLAVDGEAVTEETVESLLVGNDKPGSPVNIMVDKGGGKVELSLSTCPSIQSMMHSSQDTAIEVPLIRMASSTIRERETLFGIFEKLKVYMTLNAGSFRSPQ